MFSTLGISDDTLCLCFRKRELSEYDLSCLGTSQSWYPISF